MSDTSARANRRAFWFGSFARNGLIGFRWTTAGAGAGVDGVENAADTLPLVVSGDAGVGLDGSGGSGTDGRDGGVNGAPNVALGVEGARSGERGAGTDVFGVARSSGAGNGSFCTAGVNFGENGGVRCRTGAAAGWLGGAAFDDATGGGAADTRGAGGSFRGTGGGQVADWTGVFVRDAIDLTLGKLPAPTGAVGAGTVCNSSPQLTAAPTGMSPPQIEQRARMDTLVILAGSSRNTDRHSGHETFIGT